MNTTAKVVKYELSDVVRSRWVIAYALFFLAITEGLFRFGSSRAGALLSLMNVILLVIPLVSIVFGTMYLYGSRDFIEMLLAQPVRRRSLFAGLFGGLVLPLSVSFVAGVGLPFLVHGVDEASQHATLATMLVTGVGLTFVFVALAFLVAVRFEDRVRGLGVSIVLWLLFSIIYDGLLLLVVQAFSEYPLEMPVIVLTLLNPVDLARVVLLLQFDIAALMGYTGAVFEAFFGGLTGFVVALGALVVWMAAPFGLAMYFFHKKDF